MASILVALALARTANAAQVMRRVFAMGTTLDVRVTAPDEGSAAAGAEAAIAAVERTEQRLSTWRDDSVLAAVNAVAAAAHVDKETAADLAVAIACAAETEGAFDPTIAPLISAWDLRGTGRIPSDRERTSALGLVGWRLLRLDGTTLFKADPHAAIDEGGFGKGAALDQARRAAAAAGATEVVLDFGGQVVADSAVPLAVAIADPRHRDLARAVLHLHHESVATSGNSERARMVGGLRVGHILDGRAGVPAPDFGSVTVVHPSAVWADCLSTALYVMGPERGLSWSAARGIAAVFLIDGPHGAQEIRTPAAARR